MKYFEATFLIDPSKEQNFGSIINDINSVIAKCGGIVIKREDEGKKRLAYAINGQDFAHYYYMNIKTEDEDFAKELSDWCNYYDDILRYLLVSTNKNNIEKELKEGFKKNYEIVAERSVYTYHRVNGAGDPDFNNEYDEDISDNYVYVIHQLDDGYLTERYDEYEDAVKEVERLVEEDYLRELRSQRTEDIKRYVVEWLENSSCEDDFMKKEDIEDLAKYINYKLGE